jgi:hypothetical protein
VRSLDAIRENAARELARLPARLRAPSDSALPYPVEVSEALRAYRDRAASAALGS